MVPCYVDHRMTWKDDRVYQVMLPKNRKKERSKWVAMLLNKLCVGSIADVFFKKSVECCLFKTINESFNCLVCWLFLGFVDVF